MPLTKKGEKIMDAMKEQYGSEKGERVFYASVNKGKITGAEGKGRSKKKTHRRPSMKSMFGR